MTKDPVNRTSSAAIRDSSLHALPHCPFRAAIPNHLLLKKALQRKTRAQFSEWDGEAIEKGASSSAPTTNGIIPIADKHPSAPSVIRIADGLELVKDENRKDMLAKTEARTEASSQRSEWDGFPLPNSPERGYDVTKIKENTIWANAISKRKGGAAYNAAATNSVFKETLTRTSQKVKSRHASRDESGTRLELLPDVFRGRG